MTDTQTQSANDQRVHNATLEQWGETFYFSSLDGEQWLPVNRHGHTDTDAEALAGLLTGDGNFRPMRFMRSWLEREGATFHD